MSQYLLNLAMGIDQFVSTLLGGHPDDTVSQRLGRAHLAGNQKVEPFRIAVDFLARVLVGEIDHCVKSLEGKSSAREIWNWGGSRTMIKVEETDRQLNCSTSVRK